MPWPLGSPGCHCGPLGSLGCCCVYSYYLGEDLFVCPVIERKAKTRKVCLPQGEWIGFWSGKPYAGNAEYTVPAPLGQPPVFYKKNSAYADLFRRAAEENK